MLYSPAFRFRARKPPGAKLALKPFYVWDIRVRLQVGDRSRDLADKWVALVGLDPAAYGTHSLRRTKVALLYTKTGNLRACQLLLGHTKLESTVRYLGVAVDDALELSEGLEL
jgi:integrase